jgi:hypothetical protein
MYDKDKVMEDLENFFEEKNNRDKKLKFFVEILVLLYLKS